jgi:hypothetical protein
MADFIVDEELSIIKARWAAAKRFCAPWHERIELWRKLYDFQHYKVQAKANETHYNDPTYTNVVDLAVGILLANGLEFRAYGWQPSSLEEHETSKAEKFLLGALSIANFREEMDIPYQILLNFVRDGSGVIYSVWDPKLHSQYQTVIEEATENNEQGMPGVTQRPAFTQLPLKTQSIDPLKMTMIPGGYKGRWLHVFRTEKMSIYDVEGTYGVRIADAVGLGENEKMLQMRDFIDYWRTAEMQVPVGPDPMGGPEPVMESRNVIINAVIYGDQFIRPPRVMPGYEDIPYTIGFFKPVDRDNPGGWGHSALRPLEESVTALERAINRRQYQIDVFSSLPMVIKAELGRQVQIDPGYANQAKLTPDEDILFPQWPGNAPDVALHIDFLRARIQQSGFSDVMYGTGTGAAAGYALSQLGDQNRIRLEQPTRHLELLWSVWGLKCLNLAKNFATNAAIRVYGKARKQDFADYVVGGEIGDYMVKCLIKPKFPNDEVRNHALATQAVTLSERTKNERYYGIEQPDDERRQRLLEAAENHPAMQYYGMMNALIEKAETGDKAALMTLMALQQQGGGMGGTSLSGTGGRPKEPNNPAAPMGIAGPTGQEPPQAAGGAPPGQDFLDQFANQVGAAPNMAGGIS